MVSGVCIHSSLGYQPIGIHCSGLHVLYLFWHTSAHTHSHTYLLCLLSISAIIDMYILHVCMSSISFILFELQNAARESCHSKFQLDNIRSTCQASVCNPTTQKPTDRRADFLPSVTYQLLFMGLWVHQCSESMCI